MATSKSFSSQNIIENLREAVVKEEAKFLQQEPQLSADVVELSRNNFSAMYSRLDEIQKIRDNNPSSLSLGQMMELRNHLDEKIQQLDATLIQKQRDKNATSEDPSKLVESKKL